MCAAVVLLVFRLPSPPLLAGAALSLTPSETAVLEQARANIARLRQTQATVIIVDASGKALADIPVRIEQTRHRFLFGVGAPWGVWGARQVPEADRQLIQGLMSAAFNLVDINLNWRDLEPERGRRGNPVLDRIFDWAKQQGMIVMGSALLYTARYPDWLRQIRDVDERLRLAEGHVRDLAPRYRGRVQVWKVVNEPIHWTPLTDLRDRFTSDVAIAQIADYLERAHRWARESDPDGILIVNDAFIINGSDLSRMEAVLVELKRRNVPLDAIGIQAHLKVEGKVPLDQAWQNISRLAQYGRIHITEISVPWRAWGPGDDPFFRRTWWEGWTEQTQMEYTTNLYTLAFGHPAVDSILYHVASELFVDDVTRSTSLLRDGLTPRPAYEVLKRLIREQWWTRWDGRTDSTGAIRFQAFYGDYRLEATLPDGRRLTLPFSVARKDEVKRLSP